MLHGSNIGQLLIFAALDPRAFYAQLHASTFLRYGCVALILGSPYHAYKLIDAGLVILHLVAVITACSE